MDVKIDNIIEKIRKEGVEDAQREADDLLKNSRKEAEKIISNARKEADKIIKESGTEVEKFQNTSELALKQAFRDCILEVRKSILDLFDNVFKQEISSALKPDFIKELILIIVKQWEKGNIKEVRLNEEDKKQVEKLLISSIKKDVEKTIEIKPDKEISHGFSIGLKKEDVYYDFTDDSIVEMLMKYLNPRLREILDKKNG